MKIDPAQLLKEHPCRDFIELLITYAEKVYRELGTGMSESIYHKAFAVMLRENEIPYESECVIPVKFNGYCVGHLRPDIILHRPTSRDAFFIIEFKAIVKTPGPQELSQMKSYLRTTGLKNGVIINFPQPNYTDFEMIDERETVDYLPVTI